METLDKLYNSYRSDKELSPHLVNKYKTFDNIIRDEIENTNIHDNTFLIKLITKLIDFIDDEELHYCFQDLQSEFVKIRRIVKLSKPNKNGTCVCGAKPVNMSRHLNTKKHKKFIEDNPDKQHLPFDYTPFTYNVRVFKEDTSIPPYSEMGKVEIWDNTASTSWVFGTHEGKIYNRNKVDCGEYRLYKDDRVPNEFKNDKGIVMDRFYRPITEYILNENGKFYSLFSKNTFKAFYYDFKKEMLIRSEDDIMVLNRGGC